MKIFGTLTALMCALWLSGCNKGPCVSDSDCDDSNACTTDHCAAGTCAHDNVVVDDQNVCTQDSCDPAKGIQRVPMTLDDGNACTTDYCEPAGGVKHDGIFTSQCAATHLAFQNEPAAASTGETIAPAVNVRVLDGNGAVVVGASGTVTMALASNPEGANLLGTLAVSVANGVARFTDLRIDKQAHGVRLVATEGTLASAHAIQPATSDPFDVLSPCSAGQVHNASGGCFPVCDSVDVPNPCTSPPSNSCSGTTPLNYPTPGTCTPTGTPSPPFYTCSYSPSSSTPCPNGTAACQSATVVSNNFAMCSVSNGTAVCSLGGTTDCSLSSQVCSGGACVDGPSLSTASPGGSGVTIAAHGAKLTLTGTHLIGTTTVTIGGVAHNSQNATLLVSDTTVTVSPILDTVPVGSQSVTVTNSIGTSAGISVTVAHLLISEIDTIQTTGNPKQFVELSVGSVVGSVSLAGYVLVLFDGSGNASYLTIDLTGSPAALTNSNGYLIVGTDLAAPPSADIEEFDPNATPSAQTQLMTGTDAVGLYQGTLSAFQGGTPVTDTGLIDAVVYSGSQNGLNMKLQNTLLLSGGRADENAGPDTASSDSIQRSSTNSARRAGDAFTVGCVATPTPRAACAH